MAQETEQLMNQLKETKDKLGDVKMGDVAPVNFNHYSTYSYGSFPRVVTPRSTVGITVPLSNQTTRKLPGGIMFVIRAFTRLARR